MMVEIDVEAPDISFEDMILENLRSVSEFWSSALWKICLLLIISTRKKDKCFFLSTILKYRLSDSNGENNF